MQEVVDIRSRVSSKNRTLMNAVDDKIKELSALGILPTVIGPDGKDFPVQVGDVSQVDYNRYRKATNVVLDAVNGQTGTWLSYAPTERDYKHIKLLSDLQELIEYDRAVQHILDPTDSDKAEMLNTIYPEFFQKRIEFISKVAELQLSYAFLMMDGIQTREDLELIACFWLLNDMGARIASIMNAPVHLLIYKQNWLVDGSRPQFFAETMPSYITEKLDHYLKALPGRLKEGRIPAQTAMIYTLLYHWATLGGGGFMVFNNNMVGKGGGIAFATGVNAFLDAVPEWATIPRIRKFIDGNTVVATRGIDASFAPTSRASNRLAAVNFETFLKST